MLEREMRASVAAGMVARQNTGRIMWLTTSQTPFENVPIPMAGKSPRFTLNVRTSMRPSQKIGIDTPTRATTMNT